MWKEHQFWKPEHLFRRQLPSFTHLVTHFFILSNREIYQLIKINSTLNVSLLCGVLERKTSTRKKKSKMIKVTTGEMRTSTWLKNRDVKMNIKSKERKKKKNKCQKILLMEFHFIQMYVYTPNFSWSLLLFWSIGVYRCGFFSFIIMADFIFYFFFFHFGPDFRKEKK